MSSPRARRRAGVTLVELLVALLIFGVVITGTLQLLATQNRGFRSGVEEMTALQGARFTLQHLETDLGTAGINPAPGQPLLVAAGKDVIAFNADYATNVDDDPFAAFHDPDAPDEQVVAPGPALTIPNTSFQYPDTLYTAGGAASPAELLIFYFEPDQTTERSDDYALYRKVNKAEPELVARRLLRADGAPFFRYYLQRGGALDSVPEASLPLTHDVTVHLSAADTGSVAVIDSVVAARVTVVGTNGRTGEGEETAEITRIVRMPNTGLGISETCGSQPILGQDLTATVENPEPGEHQVKLDWEAALDETGGEEDVMRYVLWRREPPAGDWQEPYVSIPAGSATYSYTDGEVESGETYEYGLAAQDCTPTLSDVTSSDHVTIP